MKQVICRLPNAGLLISGVVFAKQDDGSVISEPVTDDVADSFVSISGYEIAPAKQAAAPAKQVEKPRKHAAHAAAPVEPQEKQPETPAEPTEPATPAEPDAAEKPAGKADDDSIF